VLLASSAQAGAPTDFGDSPAACANVSYGRANLRAGADPDVSPNPDGATRVGLAIFVTQLHSLDPVRGEFEFRGHVRSTWCDPRLAFDAAKEGPAERVYMAADADRELARIWSPAGFAVNRAGAIEISERVLRVAPDGSVHNDLELAVALDTRFDLRAFPFDSQTLRLVVESARWPSPDLVLIVDEATTGFAADFAMQEWRIERVSSRVEEVAGVRHPSPFSRFNFEIEVQRRAGFYLWKVMLPILIIVAISWSVFWMTGESLASRSRITATGVLTVVAYQFVIAEDLPRIAYLTVLDKLMLVSFSMLAVIVIQSMLVARFRDDDFATARRIDRTSRWLFPAGYAALVLTVTLTA
jgi:PAS domain-containing protein